MIPTRRPSHAWDATVIAVVGVMLSAIGLVLCLWLSGCTPSPAGRVLGPCQAVCDRFFGPLSISVRERAESCYCEHYDPRRPETPDAWGWVRR